MGAMEVEHSVTRVASYEPVHIHAKTLIVVAVSILSIDALFVADPRIGYQLCLLRSTRQHRWIWLVGQRHQYLLQWQQRRGLAQLRHQHLECRPWSANQPDC